MFGIAGSNKSANAFSHMASALMCEERSVVLATGDGLVESWGHRIFENDLLRVVADSSLYNARHLGDELNVSPEDEAQIIGALYLRLGINFLEHLQGAFSLALFDKKTGSLLLATDPFGIKPVVFALGTDTVVFAPRIKGILAVPEFSTPEIDPSALVDYLNHSAIPTPKTIFRNIHKLAPGHYLLAEKGFSSVRVHPYYDIDYTKGTAPYSLYLEDLPRMIEGSTRALLDYEMDQGRQVGCFLSGGTDSSTVVGMVRKLAGKVRAFSIGFDESGYNELSYARISARHFGAELHEYTVTPDDVLAVVEAVNESYDEPFGNSSVVPSYFCARLARQEGIETLFAGDGGDEIFGGNERYAGDKVFARYNQVPVMLRKGVLEPLLEIAPAVHPTIEKGKKYVQRANIPLPDRFFSYNPVATLGVENIFSSDLLRSINGYDPVAWARGLFNNARADNDLDRLLYLDMKFTITDNDLRKVSGMAEKAGVRVAYPLLDRSLVDFTAQMPADLKVKGTYLRYAFKKALTDFLPPEVLAKKKHGFGLPIGIWVRTNEKVSAFFREILLDPNRISRSFFREGFTEEIYRRHNETGAAYFGDILWHLLIFELWCRKNWTSSKN